MSREYLSGSLEALLTKAAQLGTDKSTDFAHLLQLYKYMATGIPDGYQGWITQQESIGICSTITAIQMHG